MRELEEENSLLRDEVLVARRASDITAKLVVEQFVKLDEMLVEQERLNQHLRDLDRLKSGFLSSVSHELRTPLTSILGFAKLIRKDFVRHFQPQAQDDPKLARKAASMERNLGVIVDEGQRLTRLINDVLDLAKIESGRIQWRDRVVVPAAIVEQAHRAVSGEFALKPAVDLTVEVSPGLPAISADPDRLVQVMVNLLNNAIKFTDSGRVSLRVVTDGPGPNAPLLFCVADTGPGIPAAERERIFDHFHQVTKDDTLKDKPQGTGLGLSICRQIIDHYGGRLWVESEEGRGSSFFFTLPASEAPPPPQPSPPREAAPYAAAAAAPKPSGPPTVLVVDDDLSVLHYLRQFLENEGLVVMAARDGVEALDLARIHRPALITMDLAMPVMDGQTCIRRLREDPNLRHIPVVVISALQDIESAGGDAALAKPLDEQRLLEALNALLFEEHAQPGDCLVLYSGAVPLKGPRLKVCGGPTQFCHVDELWQRVKAGFEGTVVVPQDISRDVDFGRLCQNRRIQTVIVPLE
jgi:signal transduction histidine kinase/DNA-binding response OmpR family regulator